MSRHCSKRQRDHEELTSCSDDFVREKKVRVSAAGVPGSLSNEIYRNIAPYLYAAHGYPAGAPISSKQNPKTPFQHTRPPP